MSLCQTKKVYVLILNWNGWADTIECLESVLKLRYQNIQVVICDNASTNQSLQKIKLWANNSLNTWSDKNNPLRYLSYPPISKPISYVEYSNNYISETDYFNDNNKQIILIQTGKNLGYAAGNNVGLKYILKKNDAEYVWVLNNDTVVDPLSLIFLVDRMQKDSLVGICGPTLLYYKSPNIVQAYGGAIYNKYLGEAKQIGNNTSFKEISQKKNNLIEDKINANGAIQGAAPLVSKLFLNSVGFFSEDYFLFFEEQDWAERIKGKLKSAYVREAIVYHKEGASIDYKNLSYNYIYYFFRNRIIFTKKYYKNFVYFVYVRVFITLIKKILFFDIRSAKIILKALRDGVQWRT